MVRNMSPYNSRKREIKEAIDNKLRDLSGVITLDPGYKKIQVHVPQ
jgi:hypothetical protein